MPHRLSSREPDFLNELRRILGERYGEGDDVSATVRDILRAVKTRGDAALIGYTQTFDGWDPQSSLPCRGRDGVGPKSAPVLPHNGPLPASPLRGEGSSMRMTETEIHTAAMACDPIVRQALEVAARRIRAYHEIQRPQDHRYTDAAGITLGWKYTAIDAVGLYVPGGKASYPSSVLMNAVLAQVAGVRRIAMVVPTPKGEINAAVFAAAQIAGITEIYRIGGAQAVAALAYGTETIAPVDKIVGPGNQYVAEAKRQVFGQVGIDTIAGPSEILVVADAKNDPAIIAADLLSQAEHDEASQSILITNDAAFARQVETEIETALATLSTDARARASWHDHGMILLVRDWAEAIPAIDLIAPEHLELAIDDAEKVAAQVRYSGAIFLGRHTPEAFGDYVAGPSHVLPTSRAARFSSGLSVFDFLVRSSLMSGPREAVHPLAQTAAILADAEGLPAHALSLRCRG